MSSSSYLNKTEKQFLAEFNALLKKYEAEIDVHEAINRYPEINIRGWNGKKEIEYEAINITRRYFDGT